MCSSLVSPIALQIASWIARVGERDGFDPRKSNPYCKLTALWRAEEARTKEWREEQRKMAAKIARAPNAYVCAAQGCGIEGSKKKSLMRCAGKCPVERKPHYCSKECQKNVSPHHVWHIRSRNPSSHAHGVVLVGLERTQAVLQNRRTTRGRSSPCAVCQRRPQARPRSCR